MPVGLVTPINPKHRFFSHSLSLSLPACLPYSSVVRTEIPEKNVQDDRFGNVRNGVLLGKVKLQGCQVVVVLSFCVQGRGGK